MLDDDTLARIVEFHGHMCPGLAMGIRAAEVALAQIGPHSVDEEVVAIVETDMCGVDGIQFLAGVAPVAPPRRTPSASTG